MLDYTEFLKRYHLEDVLQLCKDYPNRKTLDVDFHNLRTYDLGLSELVLEKPDQERAKLSATVKEWDFSISSEPIGEVIVAIKNLPSSMRFPISSIGSEHVHKLSAIEGRITKVGPVNSKLVLGAFKCLRCGSISYIAQMGDIYSEPYECQNEVCGRKGQFTLSHEESTWVDEQKLEIQDIYENVKAGKPPRNILVIVMGRDLIDSVPAIGAQVTVTGIIRSRQKHTAAGKSNQFTLVLEGIHFEAVEPDINLELSAADRIEFTGWAASPNIFNMLTASTAPTVLGYPEVKLSLLATCISGENTKLCDGRTLRGYVHTAVIGDPATAKSVLAECVRSYFPGAQYTAGNGASGVGLTVAAVKDEFGGGGYVAQAGALVLADKGLLIIDELDKLDPEEMQGLNTALESGRIPINKAGINQTFNTRCPVIAILNPKGIRFTDDEPLHKQISIPIDTLSRFDLIFKIRDTPNPKNDRAIAEHQGKLWQPEGGKEIERSVPISPEKMRKYLALAKTFEPVIPECISQKIVEYYLLLRGSGNGTITATSRDLNAMHRITKSLAKLRLSNACSDIDVNMAIRLHKASQEAIRDPTTGKIDDNILYGAPKSQQDRLKKIVEVIMGFQDGHENGACFEDIKVASSVPYEQLSSDLKHLKHQGNVREIKDGLYRVN